MRGTATVGTRVSNSVESITIALAEVFELSRIDGLLPGEMMVDSANANLTEVKDAEPRFFDSRALRRITIGEVE